MTGFNIHRHNSTGTLKNVSFDENDTPLLINHYAIQSIEQWEIRTKRGETAPHWDVEMVNGKET